MTKLEAIKYLLENGSRHSEWAAVGLLNAIDVVRGKSDTTPITREMLDSLIEQASNY